jgi:ornithine cyclodeaminase
VTTDRAGAGALRYLSAADVLAALPDVEERLRLAERTMVALVHDAELPPKIGLHPRPQASFAHAMPAWLRGGPADGSADLLGMKWVVGFPDNAAMGIPTIHGTVLLSDALTGQPRAFLDAGPVTAHRTAAVSGVAIRRWGPMAVGRPRVAFIGTGVQARSHLPVLAHLLPGSDLVVCGRHPDRAEGFVAWARSLEQAAVFASISVASGLTAAMEGADLVVTMIPFGARRQVASVDAFSPTATIVAVDYDMVVPAGIAGDVALFLTDDRGQFLANRAGAVFVGYPEPSATIGEAIMAEAPRPRGQVLVTHLGVGLADVIFGDAIVRRAEAIGVGTILAR